MFVKRPADVEDDDRPTMQLQLQALRNQQVFSPGAWVYHALLKSSSSEQELSPAQLGYVL
jgi:hypothetical protein